jgi:hypothetical protein
LGLRHWQATAIDSEALCGTVVLHAAGQLTGNIDYVTCEDCIVRVIAELHRQTSVLLRTLAGRVVSLRAERKAGARD